MKTGGWWGALALSVAGWGTACAQEGVWRRAEPPASRPVIRMSGASLPRKDPAVPRGLPVSLGQPRPMPDRAARPGPRDSFTGIVPAWIPLPERPVAMTPRPTPDGSADDEMAPAPGVAAPAREVDRKEALGRAPAAPAPAPPAARPRWHAPTGGRPRLDPRVRRTGHGDWASGPTSPNDPPVWAGPAFDVPLSPGLQPVFNPPPPPGPRVYARAEYLLWWVEQDQVPALFTTSRPADAGILGRPTTQVLFAGDLDRDPRSGARFLVGRELGGDHHMAVEIGGFFLGRRSANFQAFSATNPVLARPFFAENFDAEFSEVLGFPDLLTGNGVVEAPSDLWGLEANARWQVGCGCDYGVCFLAGVRYLDLDESLTITENVLGLATNPNPTFQNQRITVRDRFATENQFLGGQLGLESRHVWGPWGLDLSGKIALGRTRQVVQIDGSQRFVAPNGMVSAFEGGLLALPSNIGRQARTQFSAVPEFGVRLGYQLTPGVRATFGYNCLYWTGVVRPGGQIDRTLDITQIPNFPVNNVPPVGQERPAVPFRTEDLWVQGLTFGLECSW